MTGGISIFPRKYYRRHNDLVIMLLVDDVADGGKGNNGHHAFEVLVVGYSALYSR